MNPIFLYKLKLFVHSIDVLTINEKVEDTRDLVTIIEDARDYFPTETWDAVRYLGKLSLEHDFKIAIKEESAGAFLFERLIDEMARIKASKRLMNLLLGITPDPIVASYYFFAGSNFKKALYLVHDYVTKNVGVVSLFRVEEEDSSKVAAHGLGHNKGLRHHTEPIDLMYSDLLNTFDLQVNGFCRACTRKLANEEFDE